MLIFLFKSLHSWIDFNQTLCGCWAVIYCKGLNFQKVQLCCKFPRRQMVQVGKVHKVYKVCRVQLRVQQPSVMAASPPQLQTRSTHPTFSKRGSLMRQEIFLKSRPFKLFNNGLMPPKAGFRKMKM